MNPRLLDLFCGAGGCSRGYADAGFTPYGIDKEPHLDYPYPIHVGDALEAFAQLAAGRRILFAHPDGSCELLGLADFAVVAASPPCKSETDLAVLSDTDHPNLLGPTLAAFRAVPDLMWVVENVESTKQMPDSLLVCGAAFGLGARCRDGVWRPLARHRRFASSQWLMGPGCACNGRQPVGVYGTGGAAR